MKLNFFANNCSKFFFQKYSDQLTNTKGKISKTNIKQKYYDIQTEILFSYLVNI